MAQESRSRGVEAEQVPGEASRAGGILDRLSSFFRQGKAAPTLRRSSQRKEITQAVMNEIASEALFEDMFQNSLDRISSVFQKKNSSLEEKIMEEEDSDRVSEVIRHLRQKYMDARPSRIQELEKQVFAATDYIPIYDHAFTRLAYGILKLKASGSSLEKIKVRGHFDEVLELYKRGRVVLNPTHNDMYDPFLVAYPFIREGLKPPMFHAGDNLRRGINRHFLPRFNVLFIRRNQKDPVNLLLYAIMLEYFLKQGENHVIYPEGSRSRDGRVATKKQMKRGYLGALKWVSRRNEFGIYLAPVSISSPVFIDVLKDFRLEKETGRKTTQRINTFQRVMQSGIFSHVHDDSGIYVNFGEPFRIKGYMSKDYMVRKIQKELKANITVIPEYLMAYTLRYMQIAEPEHVSLSADQRRDMMACLFRDHAEYAAQQKGISCAGVLEQNRRKAFDAAYGFYSRLGIITDENTITRHILLDYNSNRIQHLFKAMPLIPDEKMGLKDWLVYQKNRIHLPKKK